MIGVCEGKFQQEGIFYLRGLTWRIKASFDERRLGIGAKEVERIMLGEIPISRRDVFILEPVFHR